MIEFTDASVVAPASGARILEPTTLTINERRVSVIGANGSGKSTLVRLINGLATPTTGIVTVNGLDTVKDASAVRRQVGFLFTDPSAQLIMPTAIEDVALSLRKTVSGRAHRAAAAVECLRRVGLENHAHVSVHALSGGQRQLLALAGVLAVQPSILVADEPTTLLDLYWRARVDAMLDALPHPVILVTHDLEAAIRADRTIVIDQAEVVFDGEPTQAVAAYRRLMVRRHAEEIGA